MSPFQLVAGQNKGFRFSKRKPTCGEEASLYPRQNEIDHVCRSLKMLRKLFLLLSSFCLLTAFSIHCSAQSLTSGDVTGTVTDPSGAAIPNATVTLTNVNTNASSKTTTNTDGSYRFAFVQPSTYKVTVSANGFQTQQRPGVVVTSGQPTPVSLQLALAGASQTVEVVEGSTALQTENADVSTSFSQEMIEN